MQNSQNLRLVPFQRLWTAGLQEYEELVGIDWQWQSMDGVMTKAPFGGAAVLYWDMLSRE